MHKARRGPNVQDLLKLIAIICMVFDHLGLYIIDLNIFRLIGRFTMPILLFFVGYNYFHIKKKHKNSFALSNDRYRNILAIGLAIHALTTIFVPFFIGFNILVSIFIGLLILDIVLKYKIPDIVSVPILCFLSFFTISYIDYGTACAAFIILGYRAYSGIDQKFIILLLVSLFSLYGLINNVMNFTDNESIIYVVILAVICGILVFADFEKKLNYRFLLISRYILQIYFWHYIFLLWLYNRIYVTSFYF